MNPTETIEDEAKCPRCKNKLEKIENILICSKCKTTITINDGLPIMSLDTYEKAS